MFSETRVFTDACGFRTRLVTFWKPTTEQFGTSVESTTNVFSCLGLRDVVSAASNLDSAQILALTQWCQEQVRQRAQAVPSRFGEVNRVPSEPFMPDFHGAGLPLPSGMCEGLGRSDVRMDGNKA